MERRTALKTMSFGFGYTLSMGGAIALMSSCKKEQKSDSSKATWSPKYFTKTQANAITEFMEAFLPNTESSPGFKELELISVIDKVIDKIYKQKDREKLTVGLKVFEHRYATKKDLASFMKQYMGQRDLAEQDRIKTLNSSKELSESDLEDYNMYNTIKALRGLGISAFYSCKEIAMNHLAYDPIPGTYIGCQDLSIQPKAWASS